MSKILCCFVCLFAALTGRTQSKVILVGNVHYPSAAYNADSLYGVLELLKPDIILLELDSTAFTKIMKEGFPSKENEPLATLRYIDKHPHTQAAPFEFQGRDAYRKEKGIKQASGKVDKLVDSLYQHKLLTKKQHRIVSMYYKLTDSLNTYTQKTIASFNNAGTDSLSRIRQYYQHVALRKVVNQRKEFKQVFVTTTQGERVSLQQAYNRLCDFWDLRNKTMANNSLEVASQHPGKKIVVLTGFFHRYYLLQETVNKRPGVVVEAFHPN
jgi:hypothetical protein